MSAFYVGHDHIDALLSAASVLRIYAHQPSETAADAGPMDAKDDARLTEMGRALLRENCLSLAARYPSDWAEMVDRGPDAYTFRRIDTFGMPDSKLAADLARFAECFAYQACEHAGWDTSWAAGFVTECEARAGRVLAKTIPETFPCWEFHR